MGEADLDAAAPPFVHLISAFLAMEPLDCLISLSRVCGGGSVTESVQRFIWENCITKADGKFHAPYMKRFLKKLIVEVESAGADVLDELYEQYAVYMTTLKDDESSKGILGVLKWVSFLFPDDSAGEVTCLRSRRMVIPLQCSLNMLEGDTGCSIWPSSLFLSEFILSSPDIFTDKSCFEVGSGVGLVGICLLHVRASKVILSDGDLSTLANMKFNLGMNELSIRNDLLPNTQAKSLVECRYLPWESAPEHELRHIMPDVILGADVIYDPSCIPHLIHVFALLLNSEHKDSHSQSNSFEVNGASQHKENLPIDLEKPSDNSINCGDTSVCKHSGIPKHQSQVTKERPVAYIASVIRNIETFNYFLTLAERANLTVTDLTGKIKRLDLLPYMQSYQQSDVRLFSVLYGR